MSDTDTETVTIVDFPEGLSGAVNVAVWGFEPSEAKTKVEAAFVEVLARRGQVEAFRVNVQNAVELGRLMQAAASHTQWGSAHSVEALRNLLNVCLDGGRLD